MSEEPLLIYSRRPSPGQVRVIAVVAVAILAGALAALPSRRTPIAQVHAFVPMVDTVFLICDILTATLLFAQALVLRARSLLVLGAGYLFTALLVVPHALNFPGMFSPGGLFGSGPSSTLWLYLFWHAGVPVAVIFYALLKRREVSWPLPTSAVRVSVAGAVVAAGLLTLLATAGRFLLPALMTDSVQWRSATVTLLCGILILIHGLAMVAIWRSERSELDQFLLLALWAWMVELFLVAMSSARYSSGWYMAGTIGVLGGVVVLGLLIAETNTLYARLAISAAIERRQRESRLLTMNALAASIAHEVKQPLTAIVTNADVGSALARRSPADGAQLAEIFQDISRDGHAAADVVNSIRALFAKGPSEKTAIRVNDLVRETVNLFSSEFAWRRVVLALELDEALPPVVADEVQLRHVLLNLYVNAIEAMSGVTDRPLVLAVRSSIDETTWILVTVADSGVGLDPVLGERIFEPFVTTKPTGTGMGLALCRAIVEAHGGRLWATAGDRSGANFHVRLPLSVLPHAGDSRQAAGLIPSA